MKVKEMLSPYFKWYGFWDHICEGVVGVDKRDKIGRISTNKINNVWNQSTFLCFM